MDQDCPLAGGVLDAFVEQYALMSPNPRGKLEDLAAGCVCVLSSCLKLVNSLLKMIQVHLNL